MAGQIIVIRESLTKENFWDALYSKYPEGTQLFLDWIDAYKSAINWNHLFNAKFKVVEHPTNIFSSPKFHELPYPFQYGLWLEFIDQRKSHQIDLDAFTFTLREDIEMYVKEVLQPEALMFNARQNPKQQYNEK